MLKYVGNGFIPGVPAMDLSEADVDAIQAELHISLEQLLKSGLYKSVTPARENKILRREEENKAGG